MQFQIKNFGWKKDHADARDHILAIVQPLSESVAVLPKFIDLRAFCPPVYDQEHLGSCTANALAAAFEFSQKGEKLIDFMPSRLFVYYNERVLEDSVAQDGGAEIRSGIKVIASQGVCREELWPYKIEKFADKPNQQCYDAAKIHKSLEYARVPQTDFALKTVLASHHPFTFGFYCYSSFESSEVAQTGILPMPAASETVIGGHAVLCVGYDNSDNTYLIRNSWGNRWGIGGYFKMPAAYMLNPALVSDLWVVKAVGAKMLPW